MKRLILSFTFLVAISFCALAQGPGFVGKHFYVDYNLAFAITSGSDLGKSFTHRFSANYLLHKRFSVALGHSRFKTPIDKGREIEDDRISTNSTGIRLYTYLKRKHIAPYGTFLVLEATKYKVNFDEFVDIKTNATSIGLGFGVSRVLFAKMVVSFSTSFNWLQKSDFVEDVDVLAAYPDVNEYRGGLEDMIGYHWNMTVGYLLF